MNSKVLFIGMGAVGRALLRIIQKEKLFSMDKITLSDRSREALDYFVEAGGKRENTFELEVNRETYLQIFDHLGEGDFLLCLSDGIDTLVLVTECIRRGIHFVSASDDAFGHAYIKEDVKYLGHFHNHKELSQRSKGSATSVIQFGTNPGLVSVFTKKCLVDIVEEDRGEFVSANRERLRELIRNNDYPQVAKILGVSAFTETDLDITETDFVEEEDVVYSTWNVEDFDEEMNDRSSFTVGTEEPLQSFLRGLA